MLRKGFLEEVDGVWAAWLGRGKEKPPSEQRDHRQGDGSKKTQGVFGDLANRLQ